MNRIEKMIKETVAKIKAEGLDREQLQKIMIAEDAMMFLAKIITPEIELMLKEQAKIVRHAAVDMLMQTFSELADSEVDTGGVMVQNVMQNRLTNLRHDWVKLED